MGAVGRLFRAGVSVVTQPHKLTIGAKVNSLPGGTINALIDDMQRLAVPPAKRDDRPASEHQSCNVVQLYWDQSSTIPPGSVVKLGAPIYDPGDRESTPFEGLRFRAVTPTGSDADAVLAVTSEPMPQDAIGYGWMQNACWAQVSVSDAGHEYATTQAGTTLASATSGELKIAWKESGTGTKWAVVLLGVTLEWSIIRGSCTAAVLTGDPTFSIDGLELVQGTLAGLGSTVTVYKERITLPDVTTAHTFADNDVVTVMYDQHDGRWRLAPREVAVFRCKPSSNVTGSSSFTGGTITKIFGKVPAGPMETINNPLKLYIDSGKWATCITLEDGTFEAIYAEDHVPAWLRAQSGYNGSNNQVFGHASGSWIHRDIGPCSGA